MFRAELRPIDGRAAACARRTGEKRKEKGLRPRSTAVSRHVQASVTKYPAGSLQLSQVEAWQHLAAEKRLSETAGYPRSQQVHRTQSVELHTTTQSFSIRLF